MQVKYGHSSNYDEVKRKIVALAKELASLEREFENARETRVKAESGPVADVETQIS
jgi:hypothetical protein